MLHLSARRALRFLALLLALLPLGAAAQPVRVASKIDTEGALLGQLMLQTLQGAGIATVDRLQLGNTQIVRSALLAGEVDLYPEYTGNGAFFHADEKNPAWKNLRSGFERARTLDEKQPSGLAGAGAGQQHLGHRRAQGPGGAAPAGQPARPGALAGRRRCLQAGGLGRIRRAARCAAGLPGGLRLQAAAAADPHAGRRRHGRHDQGRGAAHLGRQRCHGLRHRWPAGRTRPGGAGRPVGGAAGVCAGTGRARRGAGAPPADARAAGRAVCHASTPPRCRR